MAKKTNQLPVEQPEEPVPQLREDQTLLARLRAERNRATENLESLLSRADELPPSSLKDILLEVLERRRGLGQTEGIRLLVPEPEDDPTLDLVEDQINDVLQPVCARFQAALLKLEGTNEGSLEANQRVVSRINDIANRLRVLFRCTKDGCREPARLRCAKASKSSGTAFSFQHFIDGELVNHGAGASFPRLELVEAPPDKRRKL